MAREPQTLVEDGETLGDKIATGIADGLAKLNPKKVSPGQYDPRTSWQPNKKHAHKLRCKMYQNGLEFDDEKMSNAEIDLANQITKSGNYINGLVTVLVGTEDTNSVVYISYRDKTADQRMTNLHNWNSLCGPMGLFTQIVNEQEMTAA